MWSEATTRFSPNIPIPRKVIKGGLASLSPNCRRYRPAARMAQAEVDTSTSLTWLPADYTGLSRKPEAAAWMTEGDRSLRRLRLNDDPSEPSHGPMSTQVAVTTSGTTMTEDPYTEYREPSPAPQETRSSSPERS